jgi:outer membrane protein OmpA-like peptidoglycan-associated protein
VSTSAGRTWTIRGEHTGSGWWAGLLLLGLLSTALYLYLLSNLGGKRLQAVAVVASPPALAVAPPVAVVPAAVAPALAPTADDCPPLFPISFDLNSSKPQFQDPALPALITWLIGHSETTLVVDGHADSLGTAAANFELSRRRADEVVRRFLVAGLSRKRISRRAFGQYTPLVGASELSARNRRVDLSVLGTYDCHSLETP